MKPLIKFEHDVPPKTSSWPKLRQFEQKLPKLTPSNTPGVGSSTTGAVSGVAE